MPIVSKRARAVTAASLTLCLIALDMVAPAIAGAAPAVPSSYQDHVTMQVQQKAQWCWAGSGNTIAAYHGAAVSQTRFCQLAHDENGADCADLPGSLADAKRAFARLGFASPGDYLHGRIPYSDIQAQVASNHPIETRISWRSGGAHMHVVYGYDTKNGAAKDGWIAWGDPWPSYRRYNWSTYDFYTGNSSFTWTHTLTGIAR